MDNVKEETPHLCQLCGSPDELRPAALVRPDIVAKIREAKPDWDENGYICENDLEKYRNLYFEELILTDLGEVTSLEREVLKSMEAGEILARDTAKDLNESRSFAERISDQVAEFGGSWVFIGLFGLSVVLWMGLNSFLLLTRPFDPYPYIFLNLILSCVAAFQAPLIMMSQRRQETRDRTRSMHDYQVNLKAELEIRQLHKKLDHLMNHQWERLLTLQKLQMELLQETRERKGPSGKAMP